MADNELTFKSLRLAGWRQFGAVNIDFHPNLTVITGANGAGKSTILNILSRHLGVERPYFSTPRRGLDGAVSYFTGVFDLVGEFSRFLFSLSGLSGTNRRGKIGDLTYSNGHASAVSVPEGNSQSYSVTIDKQQNVLGFHIPSHRALPTYQGITELPFVGVDPRDVFAQFVNESNSRYIGGHTGTSLIFHIKRSIIAWAIMGEGNTTIPSNIRQLNAYRGFVNVLRQILPDSLGFMDLIVRPPDVLLETRSGEFLIDAASGGLATLIEISALVYACSLRREITSGRFVVTFDEPENHLHPSLQRVLLPKLIAAFPSVQFIVATHSPFIVSSMKDSNVYVLRYLETGIEAGKEYLGARVQSEQLDYVNRAGTASEILRDVLGVRSTLPEWVEDDLGQILRKYRQRPVDASTIDLLKADLKAAGLGELFPEAMKGLAQEP